MIKQEGTGKPIMDYSYYGLMISNLAKCLYITKKLLVNEKGDVGMAKHFSKMFGMKELPIVNIVLS